MRTKATMMDMLLRCTASRVRAAKAPVSGLALPSRRARESATPRDRRFPQFRRAGSGRVRRRRRAPDVAVPAADRGAPVIDALQLLPDVEPLHRQVLFGDPGRLREVYGDAAELNDALAGLWPPDVPRRSGARPAWGARLRFRLASVDSYVAARFTPRRQQCSSVCSSPPRFGQLCARAGTGAAAACSCAGGTARSTRSPASAVLRCSSLDRIAVRRQRIVAASSTALARATLSPDPSLAADPDLSTAARAIGPVTAAVIFPAELLRPATGFSSCRSRRRPPKWSRSVSTTAALPTGSSRPPSSTEARRRRRGCPRASRRRSPRPRCRPGRTSTSRTCSRKLEADVVAGRAVLLQGRIADFELAGIWRALLETGDLAVLVPAR